MKPEIACVLCEDTGWKPIEEHGVRRVVRCDCWFARLAVQRSDEARIPPRYRDCTLDNFRTDTDSLVQALKKCRGFVQAFPERSGRGLLFIGAPGVGKTHLAAATLRELIRKTGAAGLFYDVRELLRTIRDTYNPVVRTTELEVIGPVMDAPVLVLDDLGAEKLSEWVDETMTLIISTRYNRRRATIFTTNYPDHDPDPEDRSQSEVLVERVGRRIHSRLQEMCDLVEMEGPDYRKIGDEATAEALHRLEKHGRSISSAGLSGRAKQARAQLRQPARDGRADLKWPGGRAGS